MTTVQYLCSIQRLQIPEALLVHPILLHLQMLRYYSLRQIGAIYAGNTEQKKAGLAQPTPHDCYHQPSAARGLPAMCTFDFAQRAALVYRCGTLKQCELPYVITQVQFSAQVHDQSSTECIIF